MTRQEIFYYALTGLAGALIVKEIMDFRNEEFTEKIVTAGGAYNNPGNIKKPDGIRDRFRGEIVIGDGSAFSSFTSMVYGSRAIARIVKTKYSNGYNTISKIVRSYDPVADEETLRNYENLVASYAGVGVTDDIGTSLAVRSKIVRGVIRFEQGAEFEQRYAVHIPAWATTGTNMA